jgi:hypothetical protein
MEIVRSSEKGDEMKKLLLTLVLVLTMVTVSFGAEVNLCQNNRTNSLRFAPGNDPAKCYRSETAIKLQDGAPGPTGVIDVVELASQIQTEIPYDPTKYVFAGTPITITTSVTEKIISSPGYVRATLGHNYSYDYRIYIKAGIGYRAAGTNDPIIPIDGSEVTHVYSDGLGGPKKITFEILLPPFSPGAGVWEIGVIVKNDDEPVGYTPASEHSLNDNGDAAGWLMKY